MNEIDHSSAERVKQLEAEILTYRKTIERLQEALWELASSQDPTVRKIADAALKETE